MRTLKWFLGLCIILSSCSSPMDNNVQGETTLSITMPGGSAARVVGDPALMAYELTLSGPNGESITESAGPGETIEAKVAPGLWDIVLRSYDPATGIDEARGSILGYNVRTGQTNSPTIQMRFVTMDPIALYLQAAVGGTQASPVSLHMDLELDSAAWTALLGAIDSSGQFVDLDLSVCTMPGAEFDPDKSISTGKDRIVSMVLPDAALSIDLDPFPPSTFNHFSILEAIKGRNVDDIGSFAFYQCTSLVSVDFPLATRIGMSAFSSCSSLVNIDFPLVTIIGLSAFMECTSLVSVSFPKLTIMEDESFTGCTSLEEVFIPSIQTIGSNNHYRKPFLNNSALSRITLGEMPPGLSFYRPGEEALSTFRGTTPGNFTIVRPAASADAYNAWIIANAAQFNDGGLNIQFEDSD